MRFSLLKTHFPKQVPRIARSAVMSTKASSYEEAIEDVTVDQAMVGTCWAKCVFDHYNLMENNTLDMVKVRSYYKRYHTTDPEYETEMLNAYERCHSKCEFSFVSRFLECSW